MNRHKKRATQSLIKNIYDDKWIPLWFIQTFNDNAVFLKAYFKCRRENV